MYKIVKQKKIHIYTAFDGFRLRNGIDIGVVTRKMDENLRIISMIGECSHQIVGSKLPFNRQVLQVLFYNMRFVKLTAKKSAKLAVDAVTIFWQQARIPYRNSDECVAKLSKMYDDWNYLNKKKVEKMSEAMLEKYNSFVNDLDNLFDIATADALQTMRNDEDKRFLEQQRQPGRQGSMAGIDQKLAAKEVRTLRRKQKEEARKLKHSQAEASTSTSTMQQTGEYLEQSPGQFKFYAHRTILLFYQTAKLTTSLSS